MDLSKLPRLSQTPPPPPSEPAEANASPNAATGPTMFCQCGAPLGPGAKFCQNCGASYAEAMGSRGAGTELEGGMWFEAIISIGIGIFLMLMQPNGIKYWTAKVTGGTFAPFLPPPGEPADKRVDYTQWQVSTPQKDPATGQVFMIEKIVRINYRDKFDQYWADTALTAFALALILEGIVLAGVRNRRGVLAAGVLIAGVTALNFWYVVASYVKVNPLSNTSYGLAPFHLLAVIFGVVMAGYQFKLYNELSRR